jgi:hypothetical protein
MICYQQHLWEFWRQVGAAVRPVPPYNTPTEVVAETTPLFACNGPFKLSIVKPFVPDTVRAVVEAYGKVEAIEVDVAVKYSETV